MIVQDSPRVLKNKHTNIVLKVKFSSFDPQNTLYSVGFDYKIIQWNINDPINKSQSRNIME